MRTLVQIKDALFGPLNSSVTLHLQRQDGSAYDVIAMRHLTTSRGVDEMHHNMRKGGVRLYLLSLPLTLFVEFPNRHLRPALPDRPLPPCVHPACRAYRRLDPLRRLGSCPAPRHRISALLAQPGSLMLLQQVSWVLFILLGHSQAQPHARISPSEAAGSPSSRHLFEICWSLLLVQTRARVLVPLCALRRRQNPKAAMRKC